MRVLMFFVYLFLQLLGAGNNLHASTNHNRISCNTHQILVKKEQVKLLNADQAITILEDADLDLDEDYHSGDDVKTGAVTREYSTPDRWYLTFFPMLFLNEDHNHFKIFGPFCGDSSPIYIRQRVLRI